MRVETNTDGHAGVAITELLEDRDIIDVNPDALLHCFGDFFEAHAVGGIENIVGVEPGHQSQFYFLYRDGIEAAPQLTKKSEHIQVSQGFAGVVDT
jgi:hypothetical protein